MIKKVSPPWNQADLGIGDIVSENYSEKGWEKKWGALWPELVCELPWHQLRIPTRRGTGKRELAARDRHGNWEFLFLEKTLRGGGKPRCPRSSQKLGGGYLPSSSIG